MILKPSSGCLHSRGLHSASFFLNALFLVFSSHSVPSAQAQSKVPEIVVTASRTDQRIEDALNSTTLIRREDIERSLAVDLPSLLRTVPGTEVSQAGGQGTVASIFLRGAESRHTLVLIDGVPINNLNFGTAPIENLSLANIDHIEIVRGNVSSLYGSNALGGVIQIFTKEGTGKSYKDVSYQLRNKNMSNLQAGTSFSITDDTQVSLQAQSLRDVGFNATNQSQFSSSNPDQDGYSKRHFSSGMTKKLDNGQLHLAFSDTHATTEYDSQYGPSNQRDVSENTLRQTSLSGLFTLLPNLRLDTALSHNINKLDANVTAYPYFVNSKTEQGNISLVWAFERDQKLTTGIESTKQTLLSDTQYKNSSRTNNAYRLGYLYSAEKHQVQLNLREDHYTDFGQAQTGLIAYGFKANEIMRLHLNTSNGFMAPTFNDLFYPYGGNPNLRAEKLNSNELGFSLKNGLHSFQITHFSNHYKDLIDNDLNYVRTNIASAQNIGIETIYSGKLFDKEINASYTQQNPLNTNTQQQLLRRAKYLFTASISEKVNTYSLGAEVKYSSSRLDSANHMLEEYALLNLSLSKKVDSQWISSLKINNVFDKKYETLYGYNTLGRSLMFEMKWQDKQ